MDRRKKKRKPKKKKKQGYRKKSSTYFHNTDSIGEIEMLIQQSLIEETTYIETPFGDILINDGMVLQLMRNKDFLTELVESDSGGLVREKDALENLIYFKKLDDKYPNEPYIKHGIALGYESLKEKKKYRAAVKENFNQYKGEYPNIDIEYMKLMFDSKEFDKAYNLIGTELNLHKIYPKIKAFDEEVVKDFYLLLVDVFSHRKDFETAKECAEIVGYLDPGAGAFLKKGLELDENPWKRRRFKFLSLLAIITVLAIIIWIVWGIIQFVQWIF